MHRSAHFVFALGIASVIGYLLHCEVITMFFILGFSGILGILPDYDQKLGIPHRTKTHGWWFSIISSVIATLIVIIIYFLIQILIGYLVDTLWYEITIIMLCFTSASFSHLILDTITPMGLGETSGVIDSSSAKANALFVFLGWELVVISFVGYFFVDYFEVINSQVLYILIALITIITASVVFSSLFIAKRNGELPIYCGTIKGVQICSLEKKCVNINGKTFCLDEKKDIQ